jgi:hypothetical protein
VIFLVGLACEKTGLANNAMAMVIMNFLNMAYRIWVSTNIIKIV